ncbi:MAG: hypothetical protein QXJ32_06740 [Thermoplasmata archaeon]
MTTEFELSLRGSCADMLGAIAVLGEHSINLNTIATAKVGDRWVIKFLTASEEECRRTFMKADLQFKERSVLVVDMQDRPGEWVRTARALADAGVEFDSSYLLGQKDDKLRFVFGAADVERARQAVAGLQGVTVE